MKRMILVLATGLLLSVAIVQEGPREGASLEVTTEPHEALVTVMGPGGFLSVLDAQGDGALSGLAEGRYIVIATAQGHQTAQGEVELAGGASESLTLELEPISASARAGAETGGQQQSGQPQDAQQQDGQEQAGEQSGQQQAGEQSGEQQDGRQQSGQQQSGQQQNAQQAQGGGQQDQVAGGGQAPSSEQGQQIYSQQCAQCHGQEGGGGSGPALAGNQNLQDPTAVVSQIIEGGGAMPPFGNQLSDEEIAAVATHEMNSWGNQFGQVTAQQVGQVRGGGQIQQQDGQQQDGQQQGQQQDGRQQDAQQRGQQSGQQQSGQQQPQQGQQSAGGTATQVQEGNQVRVEITMPANAVPLTFTLQVEQGAGAQGQARGAQPQQQQGQQAGEQQTQQQGRQDQGQQQDGQQAQGQQQADQQAQQRQDQAGGQAQQQQGWFTEAQAQEGAQQYQQHCAVCHGSGLEGRASYPPVAGPDFLREWQGRSGQELFEYISTEMPQDRPGTLGYQTYTDVTAFVLQQNGLAAGQQELQPETGDLQELTLPAPQEGDGGGQQAEGEGPPEGEQDQPMQDDAQQNQ